MKPTCQTCGASLEDKRGGARYCSDACRQTACRARRARVEPHAVATAARRTSEPPPRAPQPAPPPVVQVVREVVSVTDPALAERVGMLERQLGQAHARIAALEGAAARADDLRRVERDVAALVAWRGKAQPKIEEIESHLIQAINRLNGLQADVARLAEGVQEYAENKSWFG